MEGSIAETSNPASAEALARAGSKNGILEAKFHTLNVEDWSIKQVADLDLGEVNDPKYGKAQLKGTVPLLSNFIKPNLEKLPLVRQCFQDLLYGNGIIWGKEELKFIDCGIINAAYGMPSSELDSATVKAFTAVCIAYLYVDDLMDQGFINDSVHTTAEMEAVMGKLYQETFQHPDSAPSQTLIESIPALQPVTLLMAYARDLLHSVLPGFEFQKSHVGVSLRDAIICQHILHNHVFSQALSIHGYKSLRRYDIGIEAPIEIIAEIRGIHLKPQIRESVLFKIIIELFSKLYGYVNDMAGIRRDIANNDMNSIILRRVQSGEMDLHTACREHNKDLVQLVKDFLMFSSKICNDNPDDEDLEAYLEIVKHEYTQVVFLREEEAIRDRYMLGTISLVVRDFDSNNASFGI